MNKHSKRLEDLFLDMNYEANVDDQKKEIVYTPKEDYQKDALINRIFRPYEYYVSFIVDINNCNSLINKIDQTEWEHLEFLFHRFNLNNTGTPEVELENTIRYLIDRFEGSERDYSENSDDEHKADVIAHELGIVEMIDRFQDIGIIPKDVLNDDFFSKYLNNYKFKQGFGFDEYKRKKAYKYLSFVIILAFIYKNSYTSTDGQHYYEFFKTHTRYDLTAVDFGKCFDRYPNDEGNVFEDVDEVHAAIEEICKQKKWMGTGQLVFVDDTEKNDVAICGARPTNPKTGQPDTYSKVFCSPNDPSKKYLHELFDYYKDSEITIHNVGNANFIELLISYSKPGKPTSRLILDAGYEFDPYYLQGNKDKLDMARQGAGKDKINGHLRSEIITSIVSDARDNAMPTYVMITHTHSDHWGLLNEEDSIRQEPTIKWIFFGLSGGKCKLKEILMVSARDRCLVLPDKPGVCLYGPKSRKNSDVKVYVGKAIRNSTVQYQNQNAQSIIIQLKDTLLPADSSYRFWPDKYGMDKNQKYKCFKNIVAPHHGHIPDYTSISSQDINDERSVVKRVVDSDSFVYISHVRCRLQVDVWSCLKDLEIFGGSNSIIKERSNIKGTWEKSEEFDLQNSSEYFNVLFEKLYFYDPIYLGKLYYTKTVEKLHGNDVDVLSKLKITGSVNSARILDSVVTSNEGIRCMFELDEELKFFAEPQNVDRMEVWVFEHTDDLQSYENKTYTSKMPECKGFIVLSKPQKTGDCWNTVFSLDSSKTDPGQYDFVFRCDGKTDSIMVAQFYEPGILAAMSADEMRVQMELLSGVSI